MLLLAVICGFSPPQSVQAALVDIYPLPGGNSRPVDVTTTADGSIWFTDPGTDLVGRIAPGGQLSVVPLPSPSGPTAITGDSEGNIWFTQNDRNAIGRVPAQPPHQLDEFPLPTASAQPFAIAVGLDGDIWFTEIGANQVGRLDSSGAITEFLIPTRPALPTGITVTSDGTVWFTEFNRNRIGRLDPDGTITEIELGSPARGPFGIVADANDTVFFTELNGNRIGRTAADGFLSEFQIPTDASQPAGITIGPDGGVWFTQVNADQIARLDGDLVYEFDVPAGSFEGGTLFVGGIASGPGDELTFAASTAASIDRVRVCDSNDACPGSACEFFLCGAAETPTPEVTATMSTPTPSSMPTVTVTATSLPTSTTTASPAMTSTSAPSVTPTHTAASTSTPSAKPSRNGGGGSGGCTIDASRSSEGWLWLLPAVLLSAFHCLRKRLGYIPDALRRAQGEREDLPKSWRKVGAICVLWALAPSPASAGPPPLPTPTATTRAATATPHLVELHVGDAIGGPGDAVHLPVSFSSANAAVAAVAHEITFPSSIVGLDPMNCFLNPLVPKELRADVVEATEDETTVRIVVQSSRNVAPLENGVLYTCTFLASPLALPGTYTIASGFTAAYAADGAQFRNVRGTSGEVTISLIGEPCIGDCDGSGGVTVDEILTGVSMALGVLDIGSCPQFDGDASGTITVDELVTAVTNGLDGCNLPPPPQPTPTPTSPPARTPIFVRLSGNDANSGLTPARALRTISHAALIAPSGYRVVVGPGLYVEGITTDGQGRAPENLVFEADVTGAQTGDPPGAVVIDATDSVIAAGFRLTKATGTVIDGFTIRGATDGGIVIKNASDDFVIRNCVVSDNPGAGIRVQDSARTLVFNNQIYANGREGIAIVGQGGGSPDARVINNTVYGNADRGLRIGTSSIGSPGALVRNNIFQLNGIGFAPALENVKVFPTSEPDYDGDFNLVFPATYLPFDIVGDHDVDADAEFIEAGERDFRLSFDSPGIDAGGVVSPDLEAQLSARSTTGTNLDDGTLDLGYHFAP